MTCFVLPLLPARIGRVRRYLIYGLVVLLMLLQYPLWFGNGGLLTIWELRSEIAQQKVENARLRERNATLEAEVNDLKQGLAALEERARTGLGMVKKSETYYQVVETPAPGPTAQKP
jgi:cell division protein FtsB